MKMKFLDYCFLCVIYVATFVLAEDVCVMKTPCKCEFANGTGIDLTPAAKPWFYQMQVFQEKTDGYDLATYAFHPCVDIQPTVNGTMTNTSCNRPLTLFRVTDTMKQNPNTSEIYNKTGRTCEFFGASLDTLNPVTFSNDGRALIYKNLPSETTILLVCGETDGVLTTKSLVDPQKPVLQFVTRYACMELLEETGRSLGSTLCIIFFSFVIVYLVLGICTKKFLMGATGVEVIPNLAFWSDLPNLIKDGWAFALNGFKLPMRSGMPATSPDPNSYDSI